MVEKGRKSGTLNFCFRPLQRAGQVSLAGSFSNWALLSMRRQKDGSYRLSVPLTPGTHEYKFLVDGQWLIDTDHSNWAANAFGTLNSLAVVSR